MKRSKTTAAKQEKKRELRGKNIRVEKEPVGVLRKARVERHLTSGGNRKERKEKKRISRRAPGIGGIFLSAVNSDALEMGRVAAFCRRLRETKLQVSFAGVRPRAGQNSLFHLSGRWRRLRHFLFSFSF